MNRLVGKHRIGVIGAGVLVTIAALGAIALNAAPNPALNPATDSGASAAAPAVVELYESQGCSSCPPANSNVNALADRRDILALNFAVTYWDQLGWKDTFAKPAYTARQWDYARAAGRPQVATPQVIINGRGAVVGNDPKRLAAAIRDNARGNTGPVITVAAGKVMIGKGPSSGPATVWLVRYDPRDLVVPIRAGENNGRTLAHRNIVRSLAAIGTWKGGATTLELPAGGDADYRSAILVQQGQGGKIVAAARL
ncbi:MAG: DUF1223 domain-containing protein [Pseudomonadota bacterium]